MTSNKWDIATWGGGPIPDVVVALFPGASVTAVARAAVREASARGARLRFVQVHGVPVRSEGHPSASVGEDESTFAAALRALREYPRLPVTFESVDHGDDLEGMLIRRSRQAAVLVLGTGSDAEHELAAHCQRHARCDVLLVRGPAPEPEAVTQSVGNTS